MFIGRFRQRTGTREFSKSLVKPSGRNAKGVSEKYTNYLEEYGRTENSV